MFCIKKEKKDPEWVSSGCSGAGVSWGGGKRGSYILSSYTLGGHEFLFEKTGRAGIFFPALRASTQ